MDQDSNNKFTVSVWGIPLAITLLIWLVKITEIMMETQFGSYGIHPGVFSGLRGVLFAPLIHGSVLEHLLPNTFPVLILLLGLFYFYKKAAVVILLWSWLITGLWTWAIGSPGYHIGASGLIYALASFIFFSGLIRKNNSLLALSLLVVFLYGGLVWGIFPYKPNISWESHISGAISGLILALYYRHIGPQRKRFEWELENDENATADDDPINPAEHEFRPFLKIGYSNIRILHRAHRIFFYS